MNHVFVDFENVHQIDLSIIGHRSVSFTLLVGAKHTWLDLDLVQKLMAHAASVQLVRLTTSGQNALDFALAYYVGRAAITDPTGTFHIISKDTGFDPLIEHLRTRHILAHRHDDFTDLPFMAPVEPAGKLSGALGKPPAIAISAVPPKAQIAPKKAAVKPKSDALSRVLAELRKNPKSRPGTRTALLHYIQTLMAWTDETKAAKLMGKLEKDGHLSLSDKGVVTYSL
jgi:hypothetical protein